MEFQDVLKKRRSIRQYQQRDVSDEDIHKVIEAAILAPSWTNSQVTRYYVVKSEDVLQKLKKTLSEFNQNNVKDVSVLIVSTIILNRSGFDRAGLPRSELGNGWGYYDCGLHNMNLLLQATELGLASLVMGIRDAGQIRDLLNIPQQESIVSVIALGYANVDVDKPKRKTVEEIVKVF